MGQITVEKNIAGIEGLCVITPTVHGDNRGYFMETYSQRDMEENGIHIPFVQDNQSMSVKGVLRGLHFQKNYPQTKLVRVIKNTDGDVETITKRDYIDAVESYNMYDGTVTTCNALFYDSGGPSHNYPDNEVHVMTFKPGSEGC